MPTKVLNAYSNGAESWFYPAPGCKYEFVLKYNTNSHHQRTLVGPFSAMAPQISPLFMI